MQQLIKSFSLFIFDFLVEKSSRPEVFCKEVVFRNFGKFDALCFLETPVLSFALFPYYQRFMPQIAMNSYEK